MVLCLVTLTDLLARRAGLSSSSELLVTISKVCAEKNDPSRSGFQDHSRSLESGTDNDRSDTYDFILTFHFNHAYLLPFPRYNEIMTIANFPHPTLFNSSREQWCGLRPSVLGQDRSETKKSVLVLQDWCCDVKPDLVTLVVIMILKDTATSQVLFIVSLFCA